MILLLEVYDAAGARLGDGPITTLTNATVTRLLDGAGTIAFDIPASDEQALALLTTLRRFRLFSEYQGAKREIGRGILLKRVLDDGDGGPMLRFEAADNLAELKYVNTLVARKYSQQTFGTIVADLLALASGWTATIDPATAAKVLDARFDGVSVLEALLQLCEDNGVHLRLGTGNEVEIGPFGSTADVQALNIETVSRELYARADVALITSISAGEDAEEVVNWIIPLGIGEDVAALKLKKSTRVSPYTIVQGTMPSGKKYWYIADAASISAYGLSQRVVQFKGISPLTNTAADKVNAANMLYDAAVAYLQRMTVPQKSYEIQLTAVKRTLRPGDKLPIRYRGRVLRDDLPVDYANIKESLWMMSVTESFGLESTSVRAEVSNVDRTANSVEKTIVETLNEVSLRGLRPVAGVSCRTYVYDREIANGVHCTVPLEITNATMEVIRVRVRLKTSPLRIVDHRHMMMQRVAQFPNAALVPSWLQVRMMGDGGGLGSTTAVFLSNTSDPGSDLYTFGPASGAITGVVDSATTPAGVTLRINNVDRTAAFGGSWAPGGGTLDFVLNEELMTQYITEDAGGLYQEHKIQFRCTSGYGRCEVTVEVYEVLQSIDVS